MGAGGIPIHIEKAFRQRAKSRHKLQVYTADAGYEGDDCIDVSFHGGHFSLTPPKHLLLDYKFGRKNDDQFREAYFEFLENSFIQYQHTWDNIILNMKRIVLVCSCNSDDKTCHRYFVIKFLEKFGAVNKGKLKS
jgi:hypothetical protein